MVRRIFANGASSRAFDRARGDSKKGPPQVVPSDERPGVGESKAMLEPTEKARAIIARVRDFVRDELIPLEPKLAGSSFRDLLPRLAQVRERAHAAGLWTPFLPKDHGGLGLSLYDYAFVS